MLFGMDSQNYSFRGIGLLVVLYLGSLIFAAITAPFVYWLVQWWAETVPNDTSHYLAHKPFDDYVDRLRWIPIIIGFPRVLRMCYLSSWKRLGISLKPMGKRGLSEGFGLAFLVFAIILLTQFLADNLTIKEGLQPMQIVRTLIAALSASLLIAFIEEIVFRGLVLRIFYTAFSPTPAVILASAFFAYTHFKMPSAIWENTDKVVDITSGFFVSFWFLIGIAKSFQLIPFLNLFALGMVTSLLFLKTRSLMPSIGLHAGLVFLLIVSKAVFVINSFESTLWLGSHKITDGLLSLFLLLICAWILAHWKGTNRLEIKNSHS